MPRFARTYRRSRHQFTYFFGFFSITATLIGLSALVFYWADRQVHLLSPHTEPEAAEHLLQNTFLGIALLLMIGAGIAAGIFAHVRSRRDEAEERMRASEKKYRHYVEQAPDAVVIHNGETILFANQAAADLGRVSGGPKALVGQPVAQCLHTENAEEIQKAIEDMLEHGTDVGLHEETYIRTDGTPVTVEVAATTFEIDGTRVIQTVARDINARKETEHALRESKERYKRLVEHSPDAIATYQNQHITYVNKAAVELFNAPGVNFFLGKKVLDFVHPDSRELAKERMGAVAKGDPLPTVEEKLVRVDGSIMDAEVTSIPFFDHGQPAMQVIIRDITERKQIEARMRQLAHFDELTGLPNRTLFFDRLNQAVHHARRSTGKCALLYLDLDGFKNINDTHGHETGDALLRQAAQRMRSSIRDTDTVARLGGDEFAVVITNMNEHADAMRVAQEIVRLINEPFAIAQQHHQVGISIGVAVYPDHSPDSATLVRHADAAMYHTKRRGKNNAALFCEEHLTDRSNEWKEVPAER